MGQLPLALSVHKFINSVGADAGFAAIIGLAILILLYFAQARETNTLRQRAHELLERVGELEARVARLSAARPQTAAVAQPGAVRPAVAPPPAVAVAAGAAASASAGARLTALELPPYPPAGVAAPALSAATRVVPAGIPVRAAAARVPVPVGGGPSSAEASPDTVASAPAAAEAPAPAPATAAGTSNGTSHGRVAPAPAGLRPGGGAGGRPGGGPSGGPSGGPGGGPGQPPRGPAPRPSAAGPAAARRSRPLTPDDYVFSGPPEGSSRGRVALIGLAILVVAAIAVGVVLVATHSSGSKAPARGTQAHRSSPSSAATIDPATVTVSVLNGTSTAGAAHTTWEKLATAGFRQGKITNAPDQTHAATVVAYIPGARKQALAVAQTLKLGQASVGPIDASTRAVACQGLPSCATSVVVTVGADLAGK